jgi:hypothetical protein
MGAECSEYASELQTLMGTTQDPSTQLQYLANSQYVSSNCSVYSPYTFTLANGSQVVCGLGSNTNFQVSVPGSSNPVTVYGCQLQ